MMEFTQAEKNTLVKYIFEKFNSCGRNYIIVAYDCDKETALNEKCFFESRIATHGNDLSLTISLYTNGYTYCFCGNDSFEFMGDFQKEIAQRDILGLTREVLNTAYGDNNSRWN